jgi:hypothetical protein
VSCISAYNFLQHIRIISFTFLLPVLKKISYLCQVYSFKCVELEKIMRFPWAMCVRNLLQLSPYPAETIPEIQLNCFQAGSEMGEYVFHP